MTSPARSRMVRCFITAKRETGKRVQSSPVVHGPSFSRSSRRRRVGSARAFQTAAKSSTICDRLVTYSTSPCQGDRPPRRSRGVGGTVSVSQTYGMRVVADVHLHSKYSRATSRDMDVENLARWCKLKGITLVGTGDFTHPVWFREMRAKLKPTGRGLFTYDGMHFLLTVEVSNIYPQGGRLRKIHNVILAPSFEVVERINAVLGRFGNLMADGRPTLSLPSDKLVEYVMELSPNCLIIPAHVWTPWFSLYGSNSGFDSLEECFRDQSKHIVAVETGLSSDPSMNWRLSELDRVMLVSNSDAHSPAKLGREGNVPERAVPYRNLIPLEEIIAEARGAQVGTSAVREEYLKLCREFGGEFNVLLDVPLDDLARAACARARS